MIELLRAGLDAQVTVDAIADGLRGQAADGAAREVDPLARLVVPYLRSIPDALSHVFAIAGHPQCARAVTFAAGTVLAYAFDEEDLFPESRFGPLGLLDDAYLVHSFVEELGRMFPWAIPPGGPGYAAPTPLASAVVSGLLPDGVADALLRTCRSTLQVAHALFPGGPLGELDGARIEPRLRVAPALAVLGGGGTA